MGATKLSQSDIETIKARYAKGETSVQLAECFGVTASAICYHLRKTVTMRARNLVAHEIEAIRHRYAMGETKHQLAECFEVTPRTIRKHVQGIRVMRVIDLTEVRRLRSKGYQVQQIAQRLDFHRQSVSRALKRAA